MSNDKKGKKQILLGAVEGNKGEGHGGEKRKMPIAVGRVLRFAFVFRRREWGLGLGSCVFRFHSLLCSFSPNYVVYGVLLWSFFWVVVPLSGAS